MSISTSDSKKKVLIGMSGGVDSSVAAAILQKQGYEVVGATMRLHDFGSEDSVRDASRVCNALGIEFRVLDFTELFKERVIDYFINAYISGITPNPCIACNKYLKFGAMLDYALQSDIDFVATGHYARIVKDSQSGLYRLMKSAAGGKDQSYVLYNLTQRQLAHIIMPLSDMTKEQARKIAHDIGLPVADKPDSQEICFVRDNDYAGFICDNSAYIPREGDICDLTGTVIGRHKGLIHYTIGQRKGIGAYGRPMFVMKLDTQNNRLVLGEKGMEFSDTLTAAEVNYISGNAPCEPVRVSAKHRYAARPADGVLIPLDDGRIKICFNELQRAVTPGQAVVFYNGNEVLGGGTIVG